MHDGQPAQQLLDGWPDRVGVVADRGQLIGMPEQRQRAETEHVRRGLVPGEQQQACDAGEFVVGELVAVIADKHAEDVIAGVPPRPLDQRGHVLAATPDQLEAL